MKEIFSIGDPWKVYWQGFTSDKQNTEEYIEAMASSVYTYIASKGIILCNIKKETIDNDMFMQLAIDEEIEFSPGACDELKNYLTALTNNEIFIKEILKDGKFPYDEIADPEPYMADNRICNYFMKLLSKYDKVTNTKIYQALSSVAVINEAELESIVKDCVDLMRLVEPSYQHKMIAESERYSISVMK